MSLFVVHFGEYKKYPPIINFSRYLIDNNFDYTLHVRSAISLPGPILITRIHSRFTFFTFLVFQVRTIYFILQKRPSKIIYFDTNSCPGVFITKFMGKFLRWNVDVVAHHHEYESFVEKRNSSFSTRLSFYFESRNFGSIHLYSQTNLERLNLFLKDIDSNSFVKPRNTFVLPNFPPNSWYQFKEPNSGKHSNDIRMLFIGTLNFDSCYLHELFNFLKNNSDVYCDFYLSNYEEFTLSHYASLKNINFFKPKEYLDLPEIIRNYNVGLILYKPIHFNLVYNETNKLYEYLAFGLTVIAPIGMLSIEDLAKRNKHISEKIHFFDTEFINIDEVKMKLELPATIVYTDQNKLYSDYLASANVTKVIE
jgi:hypothetical protein